MSQPPQGPNPYQQPYGQPQQPYQGAPGQSFYGAAPQQGAPAKPKRGKALGIAGFFLVLIGGAVGVWGAWTLGISFGEMLLRLGFSPTQWETLDASMIPDADLTALAISATPALVASLVGIVGWIICLIATIIGSARPVAIIGLVLGLLAPVAEYMAMITGMVAAVGGTP